MVAFKENVFILTVVPYRDADLVVGFLSADHGRLSAVIYRGRKIGKEASFLYNPGDLIEIEYQFQESRDFIKIQNTCGTRLMKAETISYDRFLFHSYLLDIVSKISKPGLASPEVFELLKVNNQWTGKEKRESFIFMAWMLWNLVKCGGYQIDFSECSRCHRENWKFNPHSEPVFRKNQYTLMMEDGVVLCEQCSPEQAEKSISPSMLKAIWLIDRMDGENLADPGIPQPIIISVIDVLNRYLLYSYGISPKSLALFNSLLQ